MKRTLIFVVPLLLLMAAATVAAEPSAWRPHGTPTETLGWGHCTFDTLQLVYYDNNVSDSVDLDRAG